MRVRPAARIASLTVLFAALAWFVIAQTSQPPSPGPLTPSQGPQEQGAGEDNRSGQGNAPIPAPVAEHEGQHPGKFAPEHQQEPPSNWRDWFMNAGANWSIVFLTGVLAYMAWRQWLAIRTANEHTVVTERAYVTLSHQPRAISVGGAGAPGDAHGRELWFTIEIQNHGRTPAEVIGGGLWIRTVPRSNPPTGPTLDVPRHYPVHIPPAFIVPEDNPALTSMIWCSTEILERVSRDEEWLWLIGHVDYRDQFGQEHRAGYGRWSDWNRGQLVFHETTGGMNYDRPLTAEDKEQYERARRWPEPVVTPSA